MSEKISKFSSIEVIKKTLKEGAEEIAQFIEKSNRAAGRETGADVALARALRRILGLKKH